MTKLRVQINSNITGLSADSRQVKDGFLFAALEGEKSDGRDFIPQAIQNGASALLVPQGTAISNSDLEIIESDNPRADYARLCAEFYQRQPGHIVAVTGTNGKTSIVNFVQQIWENLGVDGASLGTLGIKTTDKFVEGAMTTPDPQIMHEILAELSSQNITHVAMEASSHGLDQCRLEGVNLQAAAFTNLTQDHLDYHGDMERYFSAKARLFKELLPEGSAAIINSDMAYFELLKKICEDRGLKIYGYGQREGECLSYKKPQALSSGYQLILMLDNKEISLNVPLIGRFQIDNALAAFLLVYSEQKYAKDNLLKAVENLKPVRGRLEYVAGHPKGAGIFVDYAHTPDALENALSALRYHTKGRLICVFGCGGDRDKTKRPLMARAVVKNADVAILTDDNPRTEDPAAIRADAFICAPDAIEIGDRHEAIRKAVHMAEEDDIVLIAGKGHEQGQEINGVKHPFDDVTEAKNAIGELM